MIYNTIGYNRWPRQWPPNVPLWQRWPISAPLTAAWPPEWIGSQILRFGSDTEQMPLRVVLNFLTFDSATIRWNMTPSLFGSQSVTFVAKAISGEFSEPTGIISQFEPSGTNTDGWIGPQTFLEYTQPYQYERNYQAETFELQIERRREGFLHFAIYRFNTTRCGREIELPD